MEALDTDFDAQQAIAHLRPARFELGIRNYAIIEIDNKIGLTFKIGAYHAIAQVIVTLNNDLYSFKIIKSRIVKGQERITTLAEIDGLFSEQLAHTLVRSWCQVCEEKQW